jgi:hypothetical protein
VPIGHAVNANIAMVTRFSVHAAANGPQLTPEQEAPRRRMLAAAQIPLENPEKASAAE